MPSLPVIEPDQVRHAKTAPDGGAFDSPVADAHQAARTDYLMRLGDDALVLGQRLSEWCGHAPGACTRPIASLRFVTRAIPTLAGRRG